MSVIVERPIHGNVLLESFVTDQNPFILDTSWLGASQPVPWGIKLGGPASVITWNEYSDNLLSVSIRRGGTRDGITVKNGVGMLTVALRDFEIDPYHPTFVVDQPIRFSAVIDGQRHTLFTGRVRDIKTDWINTSSGRIPITTVVGVDAVADLDGTTRYGALPESGSETFRSRITRLSASADVPFVLPTDTDYTDYAGQPYQLGRTVFESSLSNHLTLASNSVGAMWWVDTLGRVRFQSRRYNPATAIWLKTGQELPVSASRPPTVNPPRMIAPKTDAGTSSQINAAIIRVKGAIQDPDDTTKWKATQTDYQGQDWMRPNRLPCLLEVNNSGTYPAATHNWLEPYRRGWTLMLSGARWNAQDSLSRLRDLEIGSSVWIDMGGRYTASWPRYVVIGVQHTITATRWMVDLTLIGAYETS